MDSSYRELLAFTSIDNAVDKLFRAYLDTTLIGLAETYTGDSDYDNVVSSYRSRVLEPFTSAQDTAAKATARSRYDSNRARFAAVQAYLYWFDIRAAFWRGKRPDQYLLDIVEPAEDLKNLQTESNILRKRLEKVGEARKYADPDAKRWRALSAIGAKDNARSMILLDVIIADEGPAGPEPAAPAPDGTG
jgi:hypothetical protein